jgi:Amt family ammonium transporter
MATAALVYFVCGFSVQGFAGGSAHSLIIHGKSWNWIASEPLFFRKLGFDGSIGSLTACLEMLSVGLAALIPLGAGTDRWRLGASCASTVLLAAWVYPLFAHWVWGGGWLAQLGANYGLGHGFVDVAGSGSIHMVGGLTALSIAWILGSRRNKYSMAGVMTAIPGHNSIFVLFGAAITLTGWLGLNSAGAILFGGAEEGRVVLVAVNTILAAAAAGLIAAIITRLRFGRPDASITANGWVGGLVASSASCSFIKPAAMVIVGLIAGALVTLAVDWLEFYLKLDDPGGSVSVHAIAGLWGMLAVGFFANFSGSTRGQFLAQFVGAATLIGFIFPLAYGSNWLLNQFYPMRVSADGERQGMDLHELGADAYPEFVIHRDEFIRR